MATVTYGKYYLLQTYYGKCNYGKNIYGRSIMANETESNTVVFDTFMNIVLHEVQSYSKDETSETIV